jgi:shikimate dehydrogenase
MTRPYAEVIGDPIAQSKSPLIHNFWLAKLGIDAEYRACHVRPEELADYFTRRRGDAEWRGCNVTIPHKVAALDLVDRTDPTALKVGAINTVARDGHKSLSGYNTDVHGFMEPLYPHLHGFGAAKAWALVVGSGGAARAAAYALWQAGCSMYLVARNRDAARVIADDIAGPRSSEIGTMSFEQLQAMVIDHRTGAWQGNVPLIVVNATSLGMTGQASLPLDLSNLSPPAVVYDLVYSPLKTKFLSQGEKAGLTTIDGLHMLVGQAASAFEKFFGQPAPRQYDTELRELLTS